jgi:hypothetical protein
MQAQQAIQFTSYPFLGYNKMNTSPLYVAKTPIRSVKPRTPVSFNITLISDRIPRYSRHHQKFVNAMQEGNNSKANRIRNKVRRDMQNKINQLIPDAEVKIFDTLGVWEEGLEQSFQISFLNLTDDILYGMVKIAEYFDQDSVHLIRPIQESEITRYLGVSDDKGNIFTSLWEFNLTNSLTVPEFQKIIGQCGLPGAQLSKNGKLATIYNAYNAEQSTTKEAAEEATIEWEKKALHFAEELQQKGIEKATIGFAEFRSYGRDLHCATRTYAELECDVLTKKKYQQKVKNSLPAIGINWLYKKNTSNDSITQGEYKKLVKMIQLQYSKIPIRVYPWATPIQQADGSIRWQANTTLPYKDSAAMKYDVENYNKLIFHTTEVDLSRTNSDAINYSLLEMTEFYSNPQQVMDTDGKPVCINGKPKMAQYQLNVSDTLYILDHLKRFSI